MLYEKLFHFVIDGKKVVEVRYEDCLLMVPGRDITMLPSILNDNYEKYEIELLKRILKPGMTFVDVGANIGLFSIIAAKIVGSSGKVYAFEPEPENYSLLKDNVALNNTTAIVTENKAVGSKRGTLPLTIEKNSIGTHSLLEKTDSNIERTVRVDVITLDDYFKGLGSPIDVLKIDVEGYEPFVLQGSQKLLNNVDFVFMEFNKTDVETHFGVKAMLDLIKMFPYVYGIQEKQHRLKAFSATDFYKTKYLNVLLAKNEITRVD